MAACPEKYLRTGHKDIFSNRADPPAIPYRWDFLHIIKLFVERFWEHDIGRIARGYFNFLFPP